MTKHPSVRRRSSLLATSTLATGLLGLSALTLVPSAAWAADECGVGAVVTCTVAGNPYANGISYVPATDQTINLDSGVVINTAGSLNPGLLVVQGDPTTSIVVNGGTGVSITTSDDGAFGALLATNSGSITANIAQITTSGVAAEGFIATSFDGAINVTLGSVTTSGDSATGVDVNTNNGTVTATVGSVTTTGAGADGVSLHSDGQDVNFTVNGAGVSSAQANAVNLFGQTVEVTAAAGSVINGATDGIRVQSTAGATLTLAGTVGSSGGFAIDTSGGPASVTNTGVINGAVQLLGGGDTLNNAGTFNATANSVFAAGATGGVGSDVFNNSGRLNILPGAAVAGDVTFVSLGTFNNTGLVNLSNGHVGDTFTLPGVFHGGAGSLLALDVNLAGGGQANCNTPTVADCLRLPGGSATGVTGVRVTNIGTGPSGLNPGGIVVVDAPGGSISPGAFILDPGSTGFEIRGGQGAVSSGFFFFRLVPIGTTQEALISAPEGTAFEPLQFGAAVTDLWYFTNGTWFDRESDLRQSISDRKSGGAVWLRFSGDWSKRNSRQSTTSGADTFTFDTSYDQQSGAFIGGVDVLRLGDDQRGFVLGADGGYTESTVRFRGSPTIARLTGGVVGGYGTLFAGPLYADAAVSANFLKLNDNIPTVLNAAGTGSLTTSGNVRSVGGQGEVGFHLGMGGASIEPFGSLSYVSTHFDGLTVPGGGFAFQNVDSFRGSLGARLAATVDVEGAKVRPALYARVWDEFRGRENTALLNPGATVFGVDNFKGVFGDVGGQIAIFGKGGMSAFVDGDYKFKTNYRDYTLTVGMRYQF